MKAFILGLIMSIIKIIENFLSLKVDKVEKEKLLEDKRKQLSYIKEKDKNNELITKSLNGDKDALDQIRKQLSD